MRPIHIECGRVLIDDGLSETSVTIADGIIAAIGDPRPADALVIDAKGLFVLPGIVDIHGDAFERQIMPRPGVRFALLLALADTDRQLASSGITTAYHGVTLSWEPGLRSIEGGRAFMAALAEARPLLVIDHRVQLRFETFATEAVDDVLRWLDDEPKPALAFNDHTSSTARKLAEGQHEKLVEWATRCGLSKAAYLELFDQVWRRKGEIERTIDLVAASARKSGAVMLSHDDRMRDDRLAFRRLGAAIAEFPMTIEAIEEARRAGEPVVLGAPNVVRGGSHTGALTAADMIERGLCSILASDYHYPSMITAVDLLVRERGLCLSSAWTLIAEGPALALGHRDRGRVQPGFRADLILADFDLRRTASVIATVANGRIAFLTGHERII